MCYNIAKNAIAFLLFIILTGCKKLISVPAPATKLSSENVFTNNNTAASVLTGIYTWIASSPPTPTDGIQLDQMFLVCGLSSDELTLNGANANTSVALATYYQNALIAGSPTTPNPTIYDESYQLLYVANLSLEKLPASTSLTPSVQRQLMGEALFVRAFIYFNLVNLYGNLPLVTTSHYLVNTVMSASSPDAVYRQIIGDLLQAQSLLCDGYVASDALTPTIERVRPNKWAATALLSRAYLYDKKYDSAEIEATAIINNTSLFGTTALNNVFLKNSREAIWQLQPVNLGMNTDDGWVFILPSTGPTSASNVHPVYLSSNILADFEPGDQRRVNWIDSVIVNGATYYFPYKYKSATINAPVTEYQMVLRLAEQFLIRAEARAMQNNVTGAQADLNTVRARAGLSGTPANDQGSLMNAIEHERKMELFTEWGHRWLDLKRLGLIDKVMGMPENVCSQKGGVWKSSWQWYPIPAYDILLDPRLQQNAGY